MSEIWEFPWEKQARNGEPMPDGLGLADQMAFTALRNIYWSYQEKRISREQASLEKRKLRREWEKAVQAEAFEKRLVDAHVQQIKAQGTAIRRCRKNPSRENALLLCDVIDGLERSVENGEL